MVAAASQPVGSVAGALRADGLRCLPRRETAGQVPTGHSDKGHVAAVDRPAPG